MRENTERWRELCKLAEVEQDPTRLLKLFMEINRLLEAKENRLLAEVNRLLESS